MRSQLKRHSTFLATTAINQNPCFAGKIESVRIAREDICKMSGTVIYDSSRIRLFVCNQLYFDIYKLLAYENVND